MSRPLQAWTKNRRQAQKKTKPRAATYALRAGDPRRAPATWPGVGGRPNPAKHTGRKRGYGLRDFAPTRARLSETAGRYGACRASPRNPPANEASVAIRPPRACLRTAAVSGGKERASRSDLPEIARRVPRGGTGGACFPPHPGGGP